jgi:hypothetical protein
MLIQSIKTLAIVSLLGLASGRLFADGPAPAPAAPAAAATQCKQHKKHTHQHGEKCGHQSHVHKTSDGTQHTCYKDGIHHHISHEGHTDECEQHKS